MTLEYGKLMLLKSPHNNKVTSNIAITEKKARSIICQDHFEINLLILQMSL